MVRDSLLWMIANKGKDTAILSVTEPFLYKDIEKAPGKVLYSTSCPYEEKSITTTLFGRTFYKTAYQKHQNRIMGVSDSTIQRHSAELGMPRGTGIDSNLSMLTRDWQVSLIWPRPVIEMYPDLGGVQVVKEIESAYDCDASLVLLAGGLLLHLKPLREAHDLDVLIPIDSFSQLSSIHSFISKSSSGKVMEYGLRWPLRWFATNGVLVCPFFVYRLLSPPLEAANIQPEKIAGEVIIRNTDYGVFNMPFYETSGVISRLVCRSTLIRGMLRAGQRLCISCPLIRITKGTLMGELAGLITDPWTEIVNFKEVVLNEWHC